MHRQSEKNDEIVIEIDKIDTSTTHMTVHFLDLVLRSAGVKLVLWIIGNASAK